MLVTPVDRDEWGPIRSATRLMNRSFPWLRVDETLESKRHGGGIRVRCAFGIHIIATDDCSPEFEVNPCGIGHVGFGWRLSGISERQPGRGGGPRIPVRRAS